MPTDLGGSQPRQRRKDAGRLPTMQDIADHVGVSRQLVSLVMRDVPGEMTPDERRARNVATVEAFYESERRRDLAAWVQFWHPEGRQTFPFDPDGAVRGIAELRRVTAAKFAERPPYEIRTVTEPFADPDRVLARLHLLFDTRAIHGEVHLWCIFHFDPDGLVLEIEEMLDTGGAPPPPA